MEKADSDDEFFTKRDKSEEEADRFEEYIDKNMEGDKKERVKGYLESNPEDEKERFLHDYVVNMKWKDDDDNETPSYEQIVGDVKENTELEEDIKDIDQQDRYEHLYNTRFEQDNLVSYPRWVR